MCQELHRRWKGCGCRHFLRPKICSGLLEPKSPGSKEKRCYGPRGEIDKVDVEWEEGGCSECQDRAILEAQERAQEEAERIKGAEPAKTRKKSMPANPATTTPSGSATSYSSTIRSPGALSYTSTRSSVSAGGLADTGYGSGADTSPAQRGQYNYKYSNPIYGPSSASFQSGPFADGYGAPGSSTAQPQYYTDPSSRHQPQPQQSYDSPSQQQYYYNPSSQQQHYYNPSSQQQYYDDGSSRQQQGDVSWSQQQQQSSSQKQHRQHHHGTHKRPRR